MSISTQTHTSGAVRAVTPGQDFDLGSCRALYVGTGGDVSIVDLNGDSVVFVGVVAGSILPVQTNRVNSGDTTASDIVALF